MSPLKSLKYFDREKELFVRVSLTVGKSLLVSSIWSVWVYVRTAKRGRCKFKVPGAAGICGFASHLFTLVLFTGRLNVVAVLNFEITPYHHHHHSAVALAACLRMQLTHAHITHTHARTHNTHTPDARTHVYTSIPNNPTFMCSSAFSLFVCRVLSMFSSHWFSPRSTVSAEFSPCSPRSAGFSSCYCVCRVLSRFYCFCWVLSMFSLCL